MAESIKRWVSRWFSYEVHLFSCERCGTVRADRESTLPDSQQFVCLVCEMPTFHVQVYYDDEAGQFRQVRR